MNNENETLQTKKTAEEIQQEKTVVLNVDVPEALRRRIKTIAASNGLTIAEALELMLNKYEQAA